MRFFGPPRRKRFTNKPWRRPIPAGVTGCALQQQPVTRHQFKYQLRDNGRMQTIQQLQTQLAELDKRIKAARRSERDAALTKVRDLVTSYALTAREVFGQGYSDRAKLFTVGAKYRDPVTGATWSGRGRAPSWIVGRDRAAFLIRE